MKAQESKSQEIIRENEETLIAIKWHLYSLSFWAEYHSVRDETVAPERKMAFRGKVLPGSTEI